MSRRIQRLYGGNLLPAVFDMIFVLDLHTGWDDALRLRLITEQIEGTESIAVRQLVSSAIHLDGHALSDLVALVLYHDGNLISQLSIGRIGQYLGTKDFKLIAQTNLPHGVQMRMDGPVRGSAQNCYSGRFQSNRPIEGAQTFEIPVLIVIALPALSTGEAETKALGPLCTLHRGAHLIARRAVGCGTSQRCAQLA